MSTASAADRDALIRELASLLRDQADDTFLEIARTLVEAKDAELFGDTEFKVRSLLLRLGSHAYNALLQQKKTATTAPASAVPPVAKPLASTATGRGAR